MTPDYVNELIATVLLTLQKNIKMLRFIQSLRPKLLTEFTGSLWTSYFDITMNKYDSRIHRIRYDGFLESLYRWRKNLRGIMGLLDAHGEDLAKIARITIGNDGEACFESEKMGALHDIRAILRNYYGHWEDKNNSAFHSGDMFYVNYTNPSESIQIRLAFSSAEAAEGFLGSDTCRFVENTQTTYNYVCEKVKS